MRQLWFLPLSVLIGFVGTQTFFGSRRASKAKKDRTWWLMLVLAWFPLVCWLFSQFIFQD